MNSDSRARRFARAIVCSPVIARPGFWFATALAFAWGCLWLGHFQRRDGLAYFQNLPRWAYSRGGTTVGAIYLTGSATQPRVLRHERVHVQQWRRYGLAFIALYLAAGREATSNRFEIEAGLADGGYTRSTRSTRGPRSASNSSNSRNSRNSGNRTDRAT